MTISVTEEYQSFHQNKIFDRQFFQTRIGESGFWRDAGYAIQYHPYPKKSQPGSFACACRSFVWISNGQTGHSTAV